MSEVLIDGVGLFTDDGQNLNPVPPDDSLAIHAEMIRTAQDETPEDIDTTSNYNEPEGEE